MLRSTIMKLSAPLFFDTHAHLDLLPPRDDLLAEVAFARRVGVEEFLVPGIAPAGWPELLETVRRVPGALAAPGVHPLAAREWRPEIAERLSGMRARMVALGEIGLDGTLAAPSPDEQERAFRAQLRLALELKLPVLIHCRKAMGRVLEILRAEGAGRVGGIIHAFSGSRESAAEAIRLNFAIGIGGAITYPEARRGPEVARSVPREWLVLESDAPDLAPAPHRGEVNRPAYLPLIAARLAAIRGWSVAETSRVTTANARRVLRLPAFDPTDPRFS